jgi:hypothetical protein
LHSIDGADDSEAAYQRAVKDGRDTLGRYAVLGKLKITDAVARRKLISVLQDSVVNHDGVVASCFLPRHAVVADEKGRHFEIIICFECLSYTMGDGQGGGLISRRGQMHFDKLLKVTGIPIVP